MLRVFRIGALCLCIFRFTAAADALPSATRVEKADHWSALFRRYDGWTSADGIFSIPLSGYEGPGHAGETKTLFVFSDTFIGKADSAGARKNAVLINNSLAVLAGDQPDPARIRFLWGRTEGRNLGHDAQHQLHAGLFLRAVPPHRFRGMAAGILGYGGCARHGLEPRGWFCPHRAGGYEFHFSAPEAVKCQARSSWRPASS